MRLIDITALNRFNVCCNKWNSELQMKSFYPNGRFLHVSCTSSAEEAALLASRLKLCDGATVNTKGADPALLLCALYPSLIFITARRAKATAAAKSCRSHSLHRLLCFLSPWGGGRPGWRARQKSSRRNNRRLTQLLMTRGSGGPFDESLCYLKFCASFCLNVKISEAFQSIN